MITFSDYLDTQIFLSVLETLTDDECIIEWSEEEWYKLSVADRAVLEAEAIDGWSKWHIGDINETEDELREKVKRYKPKTTQQRRATQINKDRQKFSNRADKLKASVERKKGGVKVHRLKVRKKWKKRNATKIATANKVYGNKITSKFTKAK